MTFITLSELSRANCIFPQGKPKHQWHGLDFLFNLKAISKLLKVTVNQMCGKLQSIRFRDTVYN